MDSILRAAAIYLILLVLFRAAGRRTLSEMTAFDFVLLLVIGEATQQALLGEDFSLTNAILVIATLILLDVLLSWAAQRSRRIAKLIQGVPMVIVADGKPLRDRMRKARVDEADVMTAARQSQGLERMEQIKYAIVETSGGISIIPRDR
ncbi:DUF421 domain-containing protein [Arenibaculum pallidiluteum]|uniref:DUF421 domain-containing protein n=1 Tax=Arenibaculum pallidiluteum TaxID=2812559 RepID=UPI001A96ED71|nr:YetF domain-containing protein [Arenibaculum pallidiluteum]